MPGAMTRYSSKTTSPRYTSIVTRTARHVV